MAYFAYFGFCTYIVQPYIINSVTAELESHVIVLNEQFPHVFISHLKQCGSLILTSAPLIIQTVDMTALLEYLYINEWALIIQTWIIWTCLGPKGSDNRGNTYL